MVVQALVGVNDQAWLWALTSKGIRQASGGQLGGRTQGIGSGDDLAVIHINHWREVDLDPRDAELGDITNPLLVRPLSVELTVKNIGRDLGDSAPVGAVTAPRPGDTDKPFLGHELGNQFLRNLYA